MMRRTTVTASEDDFAVLEAEARRRGVSLARVLREIVAEKADRLRAARRPRFGLFASSDGHSIGELIERDRNGPFANPPREE